MAPLHLSTTFERDKSLEYPRGFIYARIDNPTRAMLEATLTELEGGEAGACFSSGQAAAAAMLQSIVGGHLLIADDVYHGIRVLVTTTFREWGLSYSEVDMTNHAAVQTALMKGASKAKIKGGPLLVWTESPSNPLTKVTDIAAVSGMVHSYGGFMIVDATIDTG